MQLRKSNRVDRVYPVIGYSRKVGYNWEKLISKSTLNRHKWLAEVWTKLYFENPGDDFIINLTTDEITKTRWFEKYGIREPQF